MAEGIPQWAAIRKALDYADGAICRHDSTHRGGVIWTICDECGCKWADDEGGFKASSWPPLLDAAYGVIATHEEPHEEPPVDPLLIEARKVAIEIEKDRDNGFYAELIADGTSDDAPVMRIAMACLKRGIELGQSK